MEDHGYRGDLSLNGLDRSLDIVSGRHIAGVSVGLTTIDSDLFDSALVADRVHVHTNHHCS